MNYSFEIVKNTIVITYFKSLSSATIIQSLAELYNDDFYNTKRRVLFDLSQNLKLKLELKELLDIREYVITNRGKRAKGYVGLCLRNNAIARLSFVLEMIMAKIDITFNIGHEKEKLLQWLEVANKEN